MIFCKTLAVGGLAAIGFVSWAQACEFPANWTPMENGSEDLRLVLSQPADGIKVSQRFDMKFAVCGPEDMKFDGVAVDAIMPAHKHGMNYRPVVTHLGEGIYQASGMLFHMPGQWQVIVEVLSENSSRQHTLDLTIR